MWITQKYFLLLHPELTKKIINNVSNRRDSRASIQS